MSERKVRWHWQNLTGDYGKRWKLPVHGRAWLYLWSWKLSIEWHFWSKCCAAGVDFGGQGDDSVLLHLAFPPVNLFCGVEAPYRSWLNRLLPSEQRECKISVHDWAIWINPWSKSMEWAKKDPWWVRGITIHIDDILLGRQKCVTEEVRHPELVEIELDGRIYCGIATFERRTWKRARWFSFSRESTWISMEPREGLPYDGKGENSWDCGGDALCGWGCSGIDKEKCIGSGIEKVLKYRKRYGNACMEATA